MKTRAYVADGRSIKRPAVEWVVKTGGLFVKFHTEIVCKVVHSLVSEDEATRLPTRQAALVLAGMYQLKPSTFAVKAIGVKSEGNQSAVAEEAMADKQGQQ